MHWLIAANSNVYDHASSFEHFGFIDWRQGQTKFSPNDTVFIYCTRPLKKIHYKCVVESINMVFDDIRDDKEYWLQKSEYENAINGKYFRLKLVDQTDSSELALDCLLEHGLKAAPQGPKKLNGELLEYIKNTFKNDKFDSFFPESVDTEIDTYEGIKKQITVNKYERSSIARAKCIEFHGCKCIVCKTNFEKKYGELGKGFIHVHHVKPLHTIGREYKINFQEDLVPVCPNCHSMLHRTLNGEAISIDCLKSIIQPEPK